MNIYNFLCLSGLAASAILLSNVVTADQQVCSIEESLTSEKLRCMQKKLVGVELDEQRALRVVLSKISKETSDGIIEGRIRLSERDWLEYRNSHCDIAASFITEPESGRLQLIQCKVSMTKMRADELRALRPAEDTCGCTSHSKDKIQFKTPISPTSE